MKKEIKYYAEGDYRAYNTEQEALDAERKNLERMKYWQKNSASSKHDKLLAELEKANFVHPETIATCTFDCLKIKGMVKICKQFYEENKQYLDYY